MLRHCFGLLVVSLLQALLPQAASAETITWRFKSEHRSVVNFELYAGARRHVGQGTVKYTPSRIPTPNGENRL